MKQLSIITLLLTLMVNTRASVILDLDFNSLPSAQGLVYNTAGKSLPEASVFSVDGSKLVQNSLATGFSRIRA